MRAIGTATLTRATALVATVLLASAAPAIAQDPGLARPDSTTIRSAWNDGRVRDLVARATALRLRQLSDTGLVDYRATAHGYLTFLAQLGNALAGPPTVVKADELVDDIYWHAPQFSKQIIRGRRDTLLLPTDITYHRDHLGIVQNNFPTAIRLGDGDEVRDVPHPLSVAGLEAYDFAIADSLRTRLPDQTIDVYRVLVRPRDPQTPRIVGAIYLERRTGQVVRMTFTFTRAAFRQPELEGISVVLENGLVAGRFWLPRRQEIEIRRTGTWLDIPARGIIRGRWEICCYVVNAGIDVAALARGFEIDSAPHVAGAAHYPWTGAILDSLPPETRVATDADVRRVESDARAIVGARALDRHRPVTLTVRSISDFVRVNRVEGLALGAGVTVRPAFLTGLTVGGIGRYGLDDAQGKGDVAIGWHAASGAGLSADAYRTYVDAGDVAETSILINSFAAQEFGTDRTDPFDTRGAGVTIALPDWGGFVWRIRGRRETQAPLAVHATPWLGRYAGTIDADRLWSSSVSLDVEHPLVDGPFGTTVRAGLHLRGEWTSDDGGARFARAALSADIDRPVGEDRLVTRTTIGAVTPGPIPVQDVIYTGGPITGPGYEYHSFVGRLVATEHLEWQLPIPAPSIPLGRYGSTPARVLLAPFVHVIYLDRPVAVPGRSLQGGEGWYSSAGLGLLTLFDALRFDVARGLRDGRWTFSVDLTPSLWGLL
jgi:hypothetical protein